MKLGQWIDVAITAVNPDGSQAAVPAGMLVVSADSPACAATIVGDNNVKVQAVAVGTANVTFSAPGFKATALTFTVVDLPQLVATPGPEQGP